MKYYEFYGDQAFTPKRKSFLIDVPVNNWKGKSFIRQQPIEDWDENFIATYPKIPLPELDCLPGDYPIVSTRLRHLLEEEAGDDLRFLKLRLRHIDGKGEVLGYSLVHVLSTVDCIDRHKTPVKDGLWQKNARGSYEVRGIVHLQRKIETKHKIFRVDGWPMDLLIREDLKRTIENEGMTGCKFDEIVE